MRNLMFAICLAVLPTLALANGYETYPAPLVWSPDGQWLASVEADSWPYNDGLVAGTLRLYDRDGNAQSEVLAASSLGSPAFSPDGTLLICVQNGKVAQIPSPFTGLGAHFLDGPGPALDCTFEVSRNAQNAPMLVTFGERFYGCDIWRMSRDGSRLEQLTKAGPTNSALAPLSLDPGVFLHLQQEQYGDHAYEKLWHWQTGPGGDQPLRVTAQQPRSDWPDDYHESNPVRIKVTDEILFQRGGWGDWKIIRLTEIREGQTGKSVITEQVELHDAQQPSLSADGRWLAFTRRPAASKAQVEYMWEVIPQVWIADCECRQLWRVEASIAGAEFPALSSDGSRLAWLEFYGGKPRTVVRDVAEIVGAEPTATY